MGTPISPSPRSVFFPWLVYVCHSPVMATWLGSASMSQTVWWSTVAALRHWTWRRKKTHGSPPWIIWYSTRLESDKPSIKYWFQSQLYIIIYIYIYYILYIIYYILYIIYYIYFIYYILYIILYIIYILYIILYIYIYIILYILYISPI